MAKDYPAFIIDRSRRSEASRFTDDFVVCTDKEVGFIARVYTVPKSRRAEVAARMDAPEGKNRYMAAVAGETVVVLEIVRMLYEPGRAYQPPAAAHEEGFEGIYARRG